MSWTPPAALDSHPTLAFRAWCAACDLLLVSADRERIRAQAETHALCCPVTRPARLARAAEQAKGNGLGPVAFTTVRLAA